MEEDYILESLGLSVIFNKNTPEHSVTNYIGHYGLREWLKNNCSKYIDAIQWRYLIDEKEYLFNLDRINDTVWNVCDKTSELFFSFDNIKGLHLKEDFEKELRKILWGKKLREKKKKNPY
jgi:hypothetical protein